MEIIDEGTQDETMYVRKWRFKKIFPFLFRVLVVYQKIDGKWEEFADYIE